MLKIASNSTIFARREIFDALIEVASGRRTSSEILVGTIGPVL